MTIDPPEVTTYEYTDVGSRKSVELPNGAKTTYEYDSLNRLKKLENRNTSDGNKLLSSFEYLLHATGRRTNATEVIMGTNDTSYVTNTISWAYDGMYRLTNEVYTSTEPGLSRTNYYSYDKVGNRLQKSGTGVPPVAYSYNANDQLTTYTHKGSDPCILDCG